jgi:MFS family permease
LEDQSESRGAARDPRALRRWRNAIIAAFGMGGITIGSWGPRMPAIRAELGVATGTIGVMLACLTVGAIAGLSVARIAMHRLGGRGAVLSAVTLCAASLVIIAVGVGSASVPVAVVGFTLVGLGLGTLDVSMNVEGAEVERLAGRSLLPLMHAGWSGGAAIGAGIGALSAALDVGPAAQFTALGVMIALAGIAIARNIPREAPPEADGPDDTGPLLARLRGWLGGWGDLRLLVIGVVLLGVEFGEGAANNWLALAAKQNHGQSAAFAALLVTLFAVSEASTRALAGPLVDRLGRVRVLRVTTALGIVGVTLFILGHTVWLIALGVPLWGIGVSMGFPLGMSAAAEGDDPASQVSVSASIGYSASLIGPPLIGFLAQSVGLLSALWLLAGLFLAAFAAAGSLRPMRARAAAS